jgi:superfamily II DNA or RNA helicase
MPLVHIAQEFTAILRSKGIDAREVNGASPDRKEKLEWIDKAPKGSVIVNSMLLTEGFDCPSLDCLVVLRPTKVRSLYCQMAGRITRTYPGKENGLILDFLWQTMKYNLCRPASLGTDNEEDIKRVVRKTTEEQLDLFDAITDAEEARKNALAEALRKQTKKKAKLVDPLTLFDILDDIGLADYEPTFEWEEADASQKQIECLEKFGIDAEGITKGYACKIMDACISRSRNKMATIKQVRTLKKFGYNDSPKWSFEKANKKISQLAAVNWQRWKLRD